MSRIRHATETFVEQKDAELKQYIDTKDTDLTNEINVLSKRNYYTLADFERTEKFNTIDDCVTAMGRYGSAYLDPNLCFTDMSIFPSANGVLIVEKSNLNRTVLTYLTSAANPKDSKIFMSFYRSASTPSYSWQSIPTTTKTDISFPYNSGFKDESSTWISFIEQGSIYTRVVLNLTGSNGTVPKGSSQIATLPVGSRPIKNMSIVLGTSDASKFCKGVIYTTGVIAINNPHDGLTYVEGSAIF